MESALLSKTHGQSRSVIFGLVFHRTLCDMTNLIEKTSKGTRRVIFVVAIHKTSSGVSVREKRRYMSRALPAR